MLCRPLMVGIFSLSFTLSILSGLAEGTNADIQQEYRGSEPYEAALADYRATRTREAARRLKGILLKDPNNREAAMLLGTIYYDNQKQRRALQWFDRSDVSALSNESAFAWGSVYLENGDSKKAIAGFRYLLKNKGPFRPFAYYYLGVAYYKLGQWSRARKFLQKTKSEDLPVALRGNRRHYLSEVRRQQDKMLEAVIGGRDKRGFDLGVGTPTDDAELPPSNDQTNEEVNDVAKKSPKSAEKGEVIKGWRQSFKPFLAVLQQSLALDNHNQSRDAVSLFAHREGLTGSLNYGNRSYPVGLDYSLGNIAYSARFDQTDYLALDETSGVFATQASENAALNSNFFVIQPHVSWVLSERVRVDFAAGLRAYLPNSNFSSRWGQASEQLGLRFEAEDTEFGLEASLIQPFDEPRNLSAFDYSAKADIEREFGDVRVNLQSYALGSDEPSFLTADRFQLILADPQLRDRTGFAQEIGGSGTLAFNIYESSLQLRVEAYNRSTDGRATVYRLSSTESVEGAVYGAGKSLLSLSLPLWESASVGVATGYNQFSGYHFLAQNQDATTVFSATTAVEQIMFQGSGVISFAEWIRLSGSYTVTTNSYLGPSTEDPIFRRSNPDYVIDSSFYLEISKTF